MRGQRAHDPRSADVPEENGFVVGATDEHISFGGEGKGIDVIMVAKQGFRVGFPLWKNVSLCKG